MRARRKSISLLCLVAILAAFQPAECRSFLQSIPGAKFLQDLAENTVTNLNEVVENFFNAGSQEEARSDRPETTTAEPCCAPLDPDTHRNVPEIIKSRGFQVEEHDVTTKDGYILTVHRIVNPLIEEKDRAQLKPVIMQHGLMSSSVDWVINSVNVRPSKFPRDSSTDSNIRQDRKLDAATGSREPSERSPDSQPDRLFDTQENPNSLGFYMANEGYDVFLANSRGNIYGQRHVNRSSWEPKFWDFTFDEQIKFDLVDTIEFVKDLTKHKKLGYVGHSQGTAMMFGLLSEQPDYADVIEPYIALAPVAYVSHSISPVKYFAVYTPLFQHINLWFGTSNEAVKYLAPIVCGPKVIRRDICANIFFLSVGFDESELDDSRVSAYLTHMPSGTSVKNIAHYGQMVLSGRFAKFDHGILGNLVQYGQTRAPDYDLSKIRSDSIVLFHAENDWLASPKDVAHLRKSLTVEPYKSFNVTESRPKWNHVDFLYGKSCGELVNKKILQVFDHFGGPVAPKVNSVSIAQPLELRAY